MTILSLGKALIQVGRFDNRNATNEGWGPTVRELSDKSGLRVFDTALPLDWYEDVHKTIGVWPQNFGFVWCYDAHSEDADSPFRGSTYFGHPHPLTREAVLVLAWYESVAQKMLVPA